MSENVIYTRARPGQIKRHAWLLKQILLGREVDRYGIARGFSLRLAVAFLSKVKQSFIAKARGGTDEAGDSWPPLTKEYLAYGRGPKSTRTAGGLAPGGKDGFMTPAELKQWRMIFARNLKWLAARMSLDEAKGVAAAIAWKAMKRAGVRTKLEVFGNRPHEILRDRGILFNSLSPGILVESGPSASYSEPDSQVVRVLPGEVAVGTNVAYAAYHHNAKSPSRRRRLWPDGQRLPANWVQSFIRHASAGLESAIRAIAAGGQA